MSPIDPSGLQRELDLARRKLDVVLTIDYLRDTSPNPEAMLANIVDAMMDHFGAEVGLLCLVNRDNGEMELRVIRDRVTYTDRLDPDAVREFAAKVMSGSGVLVLGPDGVAGAIGEAVTSDDVYAAAVPIVMGREKRLGVLLLLRLGVPFGSDEEEILEIAESQIDSAILQGYAYHDLLQRTKELETIYRIDRIRDQGLQFDEMLNAVIGELQSVVGADMGFIMLYNQAGHRLELRATTDIDMLRSSAHWDVVNEVANEALERAEIVCRNDVKAGFRSVMCVPLILQEEIIGVMGVANWHGSRGFASDDRSLLHAIASQIDTAIFESMERRRLRRVLGRSVDPRVLERLLENPEVDFLKGERLVLTVLYSDMRGSTGLAEHTDPEMLVGFINDHLGRMTEVVLSHEGTLDKFVGDEVMALFGAPFPQPDHALRAIRAGLAMQEAHRRVMGVWRKRGVMAAPIGVGIATGEMIVGEMGCPQRTDYTAIGRAANLGARICSAAGPGEVLISRETYELARDAIRATPIAGMRFKGFDRDVTVYRVEAVL